MLTPLQGHSSPTTPNLRNLHPRLRAPQQQLQLPPAPTPPHALNTASRVQRRALARHIPPLCHAVLHRHLHFHRKSARAAGLDPRVRRELGLSFRGCVRIGFDFQFRDVACGARGDDCGGCGGGDGEGEGCGGGEGAGEGCEEAGESESAGHVGWEVSVPGGFEGTIS